MGLMRLFRRTGMPVLVFIAFLSVAFVLLFSYSTSPIYPYCYGGTSGGDSGHFMTVGKSWLAGRIPYRDMFDHKGPLIYFIDMLGFAMLGNRHGIALLQIMFLFFTFLAIWHISQLVKKDTVFGVVVLTLSAIAMKMNYVLGNTVEEYCLPFLGWSTYLIYRFFYHNDQIHNWKYAGFYGLTAGICLLTRATNAIPIVGGILVICVMLIVRRELANLGANALAFIAGLLLPVLPFAIYFLAMGCADEAFYDIILFNLGYTKGMPPWYKGTRSDKVLVFLKYFFLFYCIYFVGIMHLAKRSWSLAAVASVSGLLETAVFMNNQAWEQYAMVCLPQFALLLNAVYACVDDKESSIRLVGIMFACAVALFTNTVVCESVIIARDVHSDFAAPQKRKWDSLVERVPDDERNAFVAYGGNDIKDLYLITDIVPCYKYYMIQDFISNFSPKVKDEIRETFEHGNAKWILVDKKSNSLDDTLNRRYSLVDKNESYALYRLKER